MQLIDCPNITKIDSKKTPVMFVGGAVLFPGCTVPLRIFEPKYKLMLENVLNGFRSFVLSFQDEDSNTKNIFGTMGLVRSCMKQSDDTSILILEGLFRVSLDKELKSNESYSTWEYTRIEKASNVADSSLVQKLKNSYQLMINALGDCDCPKGLDFDEKISESCDVIFDFLVNNIQLRKDYFLLDDIDKRIDVTINVIDSIFHNINK